MTTPPRPASKKRPLPKGTPPIQAPLIFDDVTIRVTPDGHVVATDVLQAFGQQNPKAAWTSLKTNYPELVQESCTYSFGGRGRPPEVLTRKGAMKLLMVANGPRAAEFREWASTTLLAFLDADIRVADSVVQRNFSDEDLEWLEKRLKSKRARNVQTAAIKRHGGEGTIYRDTTVATSMGIVGMRPSEFAERAGVKNARDGYNVTQLNRNTYVETASAAAMDSNGVQGNTEIMRIHQVVVNAESRMWSEIMGSRL